MAIDRGNRRVDQAGVIASTAPPGPLWLAWRCFARWKYGRTPYAASQAGSKHVSNARGILFMVWDCHERQQRIQSVCIRTLTSPVVSDLAIERAGGVRSLAPGS
jgi:hypothetical protein